MNAIITTATFKNERLTEITNDINNSLMSMDTNMCDIARSLSIVKNEKLFDEDGFQNVSEYAEEVFSIKKSTAYDMISVYERFFDNDQYILDESFTFSQLSLIKKYDNEQISALIGGGIIASDMSVRKMKENLKMLTVNETVESNVETVESNVETVESNVETVESNVETVENNVDGVSVPDDSNEFFNVSRETIEEMIKKLKSRKTKEVITFLESLL